MMFACYAAAAAALRLATRETVIGDDAESFVWARSLAWGYGPQPPLYAWLHWAVMQLVGETAIASALTRAIAQFLVPCSVFFLALRFAPVSLAGAATLAIFIVPEIGRMFPLTRTHNILATALTPAVVLTFLVWLEKPRAGMALLFGLVSALAILSKATTALVVLTLPVAALLSSDTRRQLRSEHMALAFVAMIFVLLPSGLWLQANADIGTASLSKFKTDMGAANGLYWLFDRMLASWGPISLLAAIGWIMTKESSAVSSDFRLVWRMGMTALAIIVVGIILTGSGDIREHWLAPIFLPIIPITVAVLLQRKGLLRWLPTLCGGLLAIIGVAVLPKEIAERGFESLDILKPVVEDIQEYKPDLVLASRNAAANVVILDPSLNVRERNDALPVVCAGTVGLVTIENIDNPAGLELDAFIQRLVGCTVSVVAEQKPVPC